MGGRTRAWRAALVLMLAVALALAGCDLSQASTPRPPAGTATIAGTPTPDPAPHPQVDPDYIYGQLFQLATRHQSRESGFDVSPYGVTSGHDSFAADWTAEMLRDLEGFHPVMARGVFRSTGWRTRAPVRDSLNVEVSVAGSAHPEQMVIIGCHYDGEADSTQSAYDDASGCAIELGVARALAAYWRAHHLLPARTLRFVAFDAEEMGMVGSYVYLNTQVNGDWPNIVAMINEEQNGIAYPLRFLGRLQNPLLPFLAYTSPRAANATYPALALTDAQRAANGAFQALVRRSVGEGFGWLRAQGLTSLAYRDTAGAAASRPVFGAEDTGLVRVADDTYGSSDQIPFAEVGIPCVTYVGDHSYYSGPLAPWSYPYDQPQDTVQLMNVYASGKTQQSRALALALALPALLSAWMLDQPAVLGSVAADGLPVAGFGDVGPLRTGQPVRLTADGSYDPADAAAALTYAWDFGDGATGTGEAVAHTYARAGDYTLALSVTAHGHTRHVTKRLHVSDTPLVHPNPYGGFQSGAPRANTAVTIPTPEP